MPYRDARRALEAHRDDLRRELSELAPRAEALREVIHTQEAVARDLAATEARLAEMDARRASLLDGVRVASPCTARWEEMIGDDRARFCGACRKHVYDISALTRDEATRLIAEHEGSLCVRLYRRADGTVLTADCAVGARKKRVRLALYGAAGAGALGAAAAWSAITWVPEDRRGGAFVMGDLAAPETYVSQPLPQHVSRGALFTYRYDARSDRPGVEWSIWSDGRVVRRGSSVPETALLPSARDAVREIVRLASDLRPEAIGAVPAYADSAVPRVYELYGTGERQAQNPDRARLFELAARVQLDDAP